MFLYWLLIMNLSIFSMQISAFVLVCGQVMGELLLFLFRGLNSYNSSTEVQRNLRQWNPH